MMNIDPDYLREILRTFSDSPTSSITIADLRDAGLMEDRERLFHHLEILNDQQMIVLQSGERGIGLTVSADGRRGWGRIPLRLTAAGHEFLASTADATIWHRVSAEAKKLGGGLTLSLLTSMAKGLAKQALEGTLGIKMD
jgi:hypothetical protein